MKHQIPEQDKDRAKQLLEQLLAYSLNIGAASLQQHVRELAGCIDVELDQARVERIKEGKE